MKTDLICSGFGGQGSLTIGKFLAKAGMKEGKNVTWLPSYGPEMRGGTANVAVVISDKPVASPLVSAPDILIALNQPSLDRFGPIVKSGGFIVANTDMCPHKLDRTDVTAVYVPMSEIAGQAGSQQVVNIVAIGALLAVNPIVAIQTIIDDLTSFLKTKNPALLEANLKALELGGAAAKK
jgi:2-oxoglutarate ferredoxin oxidoreductase subunit gamma